MVRAELHEGLHAHLVPNLVQTPEKEAVFPDADFADTVLAVQFEQPLPVSLVHKIWKLAKFFGESPLFSDSSPRSLKFSSSNLEIKGLLLVFFLDLFFP